jgi:putative transposase
MSKFRGKYRIESTRLPGWDYTNAGWYFVTFCTRDRIRFLGHIVGQEMHLSPAGEIVAEEWQRTAHIRPNVVLDKWVVMPDHLHGIIVIVEAPPRSTEAARRVGSSTSRLTSGSLGAIIGQLKSVCTKRIRAAGPADFAWHPRFYEHIIRDQASLRRIRAYIASNPARWARDRHNPANP